MIRTDDVSRALPALPGALPASITLSPFLLSMFGQPAMPERALHAPLVQGFADDTFVRLELGSELSGARRSFRLEGGVLQPFGEGGPLPRGTVQLTLTARDGSRYSGEIDVPKLFGRIQSTQGYEEVRGLELQRSFTPPPPAPEMPAAITVPRMLMSQSGQLVQDSKGAFLPATPSPIRELIVESTACPSLQRRYRLDDQGRLNPFGAGGPLGHVPYRMVLVAGDGTRYAAEIDVTPRRMGRSTRAYWELSGVRFERVAPELDAAQARRADEGVAAFLETGGARKEAPRLGTSPVGIYFDARRP